MDGDASEVAVFLKRELAGLERRDSAVAGEESDVELV